MIQRLVAHSQHETRPQMPGGMRASTVESKTHDGHAAQGPAVATQTDASHVRACRYGADEATIREDRERKAGRATAQSKVAWRLLW